MTKYELYKFARDKSWEVLLACNIHELPVKLSTVWKQYGCVVRSYQKSKEMIEHIGLEAQSEQTDGFTVLRNGTYYIFYNDVLPHGRQRFTIAHELGHIICGHLKDGQCTRVNREPSGIDTPEEYQANIFASRLLAPACVLEETDNITPEQIMNLCDISMTAAKFRAERMDVLHRRQAYYKSPLEKLVRQQFSAFIQETL